MSKIIYNKIEKDYIMLNDGQEICPRCEGAGYHNMSDVEEEREYIGLDCHVCDGYGYVDWAKLPRCGDWEQEDIEFEESLEMERIEDAYEEELWEEDNSSFNFDK